MLIKYTFDSSQIPAGTIVTADLADAEITQPKVKIRTVTKTSTRVKPSFILQSVLPIQPAKTDNH